MLAFALAHAPCTLFNDGAGIAAAQHNRIEVERQPDIVGEPLQERSITLFTFTLAPDERSLALRPPWHTSEERAFHPIRGTAP